MFEYDFVTCPVEYTRNKPSAEAHRALIRERAAAGWRLVQIFILMPAAVPCEYELIFERRAGG